MPSRVVQYLLIHTIVSGIVMMVTSTRVTGVNVVMMEPTMQTVTTARAVTEENYQLKM